MDNSFKTFYELFEDQVRKTPDNIALKFGDEVLTYKELNEKSNKLARTLVEKGVKPEKLVGIMIESSLETMVAILAVMKAGGAYVPIDPTWPKKRISHIFEDSNPSIVIIKGKNNTLLNEDLLTSKQEHENIDLSDEKNYNKNFDNLNIKNQPNNLAYVIYTSGTTGHPKGVLIEHESLSSRLLWRKSEYQITPKDNILQFLSYAFDAFVFSAFTPLISGASTVILGKDSVKEPIAIRDSIRNNKITHFISVPLLYSALLDCSIKEDLASIRSITLAGDKLTKQLVRRSKEIAPSIMINNEYGLTETTIVATIQNDINTNDKITIGKAIKDTPIFLINDNNELCKSGEAGEIIIGGIGICRGYLNRPDLNSSKFIEIPKLGRFFRTGDIARLNKDLSFDYLGRSDSQVKIGGYRIELGEIESTLQNHTNIKDNATVVKQTYGGTKTLFVYYTTKDSKPLDSLDIKAFLKNDLPDQMVPSNYVFLKKLPSNSNGKIDRNHLQNMPIEKENIPEQNLVKCRNIADETIMNVISEIIGHKFFGIDHDIVNELGADSVTLLQISSKLHRKALNIEIQDFYKLRTIRNISDHIENEHHNSHHHTPGIPNIDGLETTIANLPLPEFIGEKTIPKNIFLTGATGYLGAHILFDIIKSTNAKVHCLVRAKDSPDAKNRLIKVLDYYFKGKLSQSELNRIDVIAGDFAKKKFNMPIEKYNELGGICDLFIHSGAVIKHYGDTNEFRQINIEGTTNVVKFASKFKLRLSHISTTGITGTNEYKYNNGKVLTLSENNLFVGQSYSDSPYIWSKIIAEDIVIKSMKKGLDAAIFRMGNLSSRWTDGVFQPNITDNMFSKLIQSIIVMGEFPKELMSAKVEFTPIDYASKAVLDLSLRRDSSNRAFHISNFENAISLGQLVEMLNKNGANIKIKDVSFMDFCTDFEKAHPENLKELSFFQTNGNRLASKSKVSLSFEETKKCLRKCDFFWPIIDKNYIKRILTHWQKDGFLRIDNKLLQRAKSNMHMVH